MSSGPSTRSFRRAVSVCIAIAGTIVALLPVSGLGAQMLGVPVLQNAFANPGFTVAGNFATEPDAMAYGVAAAWSPGGARFQLSGGAGAWVPDEGSSLPTAGLRVMVPVLQLLGGSLGIAAFGGGGVANRDELSIVSVPVGAAIGYRMAFGSRGVSAYAAPFYSWSRASVEGGESVNAGVVRASVGVDVGLFRTLGLTAGAEFGATPDDGDPGPRGTRFGIGLSWAFGGG